MAKKTAYHMTQAEFAKRKGVSQPAIAKMIRSGKLQGAFRKIGGRYKIDPKKADILFESIHNPARSITSKESKQGKEQQTPVKSIPIDAIASAGPGQLIAGQLISYAEAARREKIAKAALLELDLKTREGELVERERVQNAAAKIATLVRTGFEAIPAKVAPSIAGLKVPADIARILQREVKAVLADLSKGIADLDI